MRLYVRSNHGEYQLNKDASLFRTRAFARGKAGAIAVMDDATAHQVRLRVHDKLEKDLEMDDGSASQATSPVELTFDFLVYPAMLSIFASIIYWCWMRRKVDEIIAAQKIQNEPGGQSKEAIEKLYHEGLKSEINANTLLLFSKGFCMVLFVAVANCIHGNFIKEEINNSYGKWISTFMAGTFAAAGVFIGMWMATNAIRRFNDKVKVDNDQANAEYKAYSTVVGSYTAAIHIISHEIEHEIEHSNVSDNWLYVGIGITLVVFAAMIYYLIPRAAEGFRQAAVEEREGYTKKPLAFWRGVCDGPKQEADDVLAAREAVTSSSHYKSLT